MDWTKIIAQYLPQVIQWLTGQADKAVAGPVAPVQVTITPENITYKLVRKEFRPDGIFSELYDQNGQLIAHTLEHSYDNKPKLYNGQFKCVRGPHRLHNMTQDFITFEITGVQGHTDILFHWGNFNKDSEGCVLLGKAEVTGADGANMVTSSKVEFSEFMTALEGVNEFQLIVS